MAQDVDGLKSFLANIAIFGGLEDATLNHLIAAMVEERHPKGAIICREGDTGRSMYVVRTGEVVVCRHTSGGGLLKMIRLGPGEIVGEMTLIDIQPRSATVIVEEPAVLYSLTNRDLYRLYCDDVSGYVMVLQNLCRELSRRLRRADERISQLAERVDDESTQIRGSTRAPRPKP